MTEETTTVDVVSESTTSAELTKTQDAETQSKVKPTEVLRELSKQFSVNLFEDGATALIEKFGVKDTTIKTLEQQVQELTESSKLFTQKEQEYQVKIEALGMGFKADVLDEVMALAKVNIKDGQTLTDGLKAVREKYGSVFTVNKNIGTQHNDMKGEKPDLPKSEMEKYLASDPKYRAYNKQKS